MEGDYYQQTAQQQQIQEQLRIIRESLKNVLDKKARERLSNIRLIKPDLATQLELYLFQLQQAGQLKTVTDQQLVMILKELGNKKNMNIKRK
jgi:programmed cell death protein 5